MPSRVCAEAEPTPPLSVAVVAPKPAPALPSANNPAPAFRRRLIAELAIGRIAAPVLVAAVEQVEHDRARHDRHHRVADAEAAALLAHISLHAGGGIEPEGRAAGQHDGVDAFHGLRRIEQGGLARAGPAAAHIDARHHGLVEHHDGRAGAELGVAGMADADAGNIGDEIACHGVVLRITAQTEPILAVRSILRRLEAKSRAGLSAECLNCGLFPPGCIGPFAAGT